MKNFLFILLVLIILGLGVLWWKDNSRLPVASEPETKAELCFAKYEDSADSEFEDAYTLRINIDGEKATGALRLLPAEKDALVGTFEGTVSPADQASQSRSAHLWWNTEGEGMTAKQELAIMIKEGMANVGFGEMMDRGDGVYVYKDPAKVDYSFALPSISCEDFAERESVESYLWNNIVTLSPIAPALGGNWYVVDATVDLTNNTGTVVYEDGHVQEKRNFTYTTDGEGKVQSLVIQ
jgi:hypothetical protein